MTNLDYIVLSGSFLLLQFGKLSKNEAAWCQSSSPWRALQPVLEAGSPYEMLIKMTFSPASDVFTCMMLVAAAIAHWSPSETEMPARLSNLLSVIDTRSELDDAFKSPRVLKMLLAAAASKKPHVSEASRRAKKLLAHVLKKFPDFFKLSILKTKSGRLKFKPEDVEKWM